MRTIPLRSTLRLICNKVYAASARSDLPRFNQHSSFHREIGERLRQRLEIDLHEGKAGLSLLVASGFLRMV